jgi:uncharacterized membrane protein YqiK
MEEFFRDVSPFQATAATLLAFGVVLIFSNRLVTKGHSDERVEAERRRADELIGAERERANAAEARERKVEDAWRESQRAHGEKDEQIGMAIKSIEKIVTAVENARRETGVGEP